MALRFAILASLASKSQTGYEIAREFDAAVGHFWQATHQQIYRELSKLSEDSAVVFEQIQQVSKPAKKRYQITATGRSALTEWLALPTPAAPVRDPLLVKLSAAYLANKTVITEELRRHQILYRNRLKEFRSIESRHFSAKRKLTTKGQYLYFTLRRGITSAEAWLTWADEVLEYLSNS